MLNKPRYQDSYTPFDAIHSNISVTDGYGRTVVGKPRLNFWFRLACLFNPGKLLDYIHVRDVLLAQAANSAAISVYDKGYTAGRKSMARLQAPPPTPTKSQSRVSNAPAAASSFTGSGPTSETREVYVDNTAANLAMASMLHNTGLHAPAAAPVQEDSFTPISTPVESDCRTSSFSGGSDSYDSGSSVSTDSGSYGD